VLLSTIEYPPYPPEACFSVGGRVLLSGMEFLSQLDPKDPLGRTPPNVPMPAGDCPPLEQRTTGPVDYMPAEVVTGIAEPPADCAEPCVRIDAIGAIFVITEDSPEYGFDHKRLRASGLDTHNDRKGLRARLRVPTVVDGHADVVGVIPSG
jgi:hypothetical protein